MKKKLLVFLLLFASVFQLQAQSNKAYDELKEAFVKFENKNYGEAYPYFQEMLQRYPKEPIYQYYVGVCLFHLEKDPQQSIDYLRSAATRDVPNRVYYYLGIAYLKSYAFKEALESFKWYGRGASKKEIRDSDFQNYQSMAQNGLYLTKYIQKPTVYQKEEYEAEDFYKYYTLDGLEGYFTDVHAYFNREKDSLKDDAVLYVPSVSGKDIYFSKVNERRGDYDLYKATQLTDTTWSEPENLGEVINTPFDENYPFLHFDGTTLYFASKGHYSMGGYDLYKSTWNWDLQEWTEPENLDFPINSPFDDVLFVASPNKRNAMFASNRDLNNNTIHIYQIKLTSSEPYIELESHSEVIKYAKLKENAKFKEEEASTQYQREQKELITIKQDEDFLGKSAYDSLLNSAMNYQLKADSLRWIIEEKRNAFDVTKDGQARAVLSNQLVELEQQIYSLQKKADQCYAKVREIEQKNLASKKTIYQKVEKVQDVKEHKEKEKSIFYQPTPDSLNMAKLVLEEDTTENDSIDMANFGLRIENPSIYNRSNPIPLNESLPDGVVYMIQLGAFSSEKDPALFKGLTPLTSIKSEGSKIRKYYAGKFFTVANAEKKLGLVQSRGFKDAYIIAFQNGDIIPIKNAVKLESDREIKVQAAAPVYQNEKEKKDSLGIIFVLKAQVNSKDSILLDSISSSLDAQLELFIVDDSDYSRIMIKPFKSYREVIPVKKKLDTMLSKESEIHAYFAENQIPLEQARKIIK